MDGPTFKICISYKGFDFNQNYIVIIILIIVYFPALIS